MFAKLKAHYGGDKSLNDYISLFQADNPTYGNEFGSATFYSKTTSESLNDAAMRFWTAYVP
jgi:hypothetical protein